MQLEFSNFEIFASVLNGYDLDLKQLDRGTFYASLQHIVCDSVVINRIASTRRFEVHGTPPPDLRTFGIPTANCLPFTWRNKYSPGNTIQIYKPSTELEMVTHPLFEAIDVSIPEETFNILCQRWGYPELDRLTGTREMIVCDPVIMKHLRDTLQTICITVDNNSDSLKHDMGLQDLIKYDVPHLLAQALMTAETNNLKLSPDKRSLILKSAIDYVKQTPHDQISMSQFCSDNDINIRSLQRAFIEQYGISPKSYAKAYHLNSVYKKLLQSNTKTNRIADIASRHGFWHMSQFAADYRRHFGELPSETFKAR
jgi:AraC family ethanolamine operon transcriptional activator